MNMRNAVWLAVLSAATMLAGCGTPHLGQPVQKTAPIAHATDAGVHETLRQRAIADAGNILAAFIPPPHAVRTTRLPVSLLAQAPTEPLSPDVVIRTGWWRVAGQPGDVLAWIQAHKPPGFSRSGTGSGGTVTASMSYVEFSLPDVPGVLLNRALTVAVAAAGLDQTAIRVDGEDLWVPAKPAAEYIPGSAAVVTITPLAGEVSPAKADHQITITDRAQTARIAAVVNALPLYPVVDWIECGPGPEAGMRLTFRASAAGPVVAMVTAYQELCPLVQFVTGRKTMPPLDGAETLLQRVMAIAGFRWPDFPAPGPTATPTS